MSWKRSFSNTLKNSCFELSEGFTFMKRQYRITVSEQDYYLDLFFYHLTSRAFVAIALKRGEFKPEHAGKINFHSSVVDEKLRHSTDQPTIGLILYQTKDQILAEYALRGILKPIGVSDYELTCTLPEDLKSSLPSIEELKAELSHYSNQYTAEEML
nr:PDDEXK nuclease domain-containing protein [Photorhabdus temperata]